MILTEELNFNSHSKSRSPCRFRQRQQKPKTKRDLCQRSNKSVSSSDSEKPFVKDKYLHVDSRSPAHTAP